MLKRAWVWLIGLMEDAQGVPDEARVGAGAIIVAYIYLGYQSVMLSPTHAFDFQAFGIGAGAIAGGLGAWVGLRKNY